MSATPVSTTSIATSVSSKREAYCTCGGARPLSVEAVVDLSSDVSSHELPTLSDCIASRLEAVQSRGYDEATQAPIKLAELLSNAR
jgi:hypothetical protein